MPSFIVRLDDLCPTMRWDRFERFEHGMRDLGLPALIGIVPDCRDPELEQDTAKEEFWEVARSLRRRDWTVAQHGFTHVYDSDAPNLHNRPGRSEFAGHPLDVQRERLARGAEILEAEGLRSEVFMAPAHTFDLQTLTALRETGFTKITDGYGLWPYREHGLTFVPQLFSRPIHFGIGVYTICLHLNHTPDAAIDETLGFLRRNAGRVISFDAATPSRTPLAAPARALTGRGLQAARKVRRARALSR